MIKVELKTQIDDSYEIHIEHGLRKKIAEILKKEQYGKKYAVITDSKVYPLYLKSLRKHFKDQGIEAKIYKFKNGETQKNLKTVETILNQMCEDGFDRSDCIIAYGGGVVGDIAGIIASLFMRGIPFVQIPTTLLAMVDSSVGGKTGGNLQAGKNLFGSFHQPRTVLIDPEHLQSLSASHIKNGLAEAIKTAIIADEKYFEFLEENIDDILELKPKAITKTIEESLKIKAKIVQEDEKESGKRMLLNYGHTYGHAIEKMTDYKLLHGLAVAIGMVLANKIAVKEGILERDASKRIKALIKKADLPFVIVNKPKLADLKNDKKKSGNNIRFILPTKIGHAIIHEIPWK